MTEQPVVPPDGEPTADAAGTGAGHAPTGTQPMSLEEFRAPWTQLREAVRAILGGQPSPRLVRVTARRIAGEIQLTADAVLKEREARP
ncbi:hypothetical protein [Streptomyces diastatochromogenes]|uniref:hypothetical protein n=1 Tax=Streptomyces diastatochromogenes TaxID=42236 RepID=UPI003691D46B